MKETVDYELVPNKDDDNAWNIRFLTGEFTETVVLIGTIKIGEETDDGSGDHHLTFSYDIVYSPDESLTPENETLQDIVGDILLEIITKHAERVTNKEAVKP